jgi:hypothetical protein
LSLRLNLFRVKIDMAITILFIDFATGLCENPRQQGLVGLCGSEASSSRKSPPSKDGILSKTSVARFLG